MTCPDQSHFRTQLSSLLAAVVMAQAEVRGLTLEQEWHGQREHIMWLLGGGREETAT